MNKPIFYISISYLLFTFFACQQEKTLFQLKDPAQTGIHFSNRITENDTFNILTYEYVYNGGGVGIGDFNRDGLQDVFFTGNMVENKLYLNKGNFKFEDITQSAGLAQQNQWNSGVAVVDINNDGWLDLYVCATTYQPSYRRKNSLYINQTKEEDTQVIFKEMATDYGLDDDSHTTSAAFFDYDNDGDLDVYLVVNQMDEKAIPNRYRKKITDGTSHKTDKLFRNDFDAAKGHPVFTDISKEAGIQTEGFGLGINICDFNQDGWKDIYVTNDYLTNDLLWINNGLKGEDTITFSDQAATYFKHTSYSAMGNDVVDINQDGRVDVIAVDMLPEDNYRRKTMLPPNNYTGYLNNERFGYQYQYVRNTLQLNQGNQAHKNQPIFSEIAMQAGVSATDWSWSPLINDFDNDGKRDLIITNGFPNDVTDRDFMDYNNDKGAFLTQKELLARIPSVKIKNYAYRNQMDSTAFLPSFEEVTDNWGLDQRSFSNGAAYVDLDNDGDLDYIVNNINDSAFVYQNRLIDTQKEHANWLKITFKGSEKNKNGLGAIINLYTEKGIQTWENTPYRGYLSSVEAGVHFGLGAIIQIDSISIHWQEGKRQILSNIDANQVLEVDIQNASNFKAEKSSNDPFFEEVTADLNINHIHQESDYIDFNVQPLLPHKLSQYGPSLSVADINQDGLDDLFMSGSHFYKSQFFIQQENGTFLQKDILPGVEGDAKRGEELGSLFFDADNDGDQDLYLVHGGYEFPLSEPCYQDWLFLNNNGTFERVKDALPSFLSSGSCVKAADFDQDGDLDLFIGGRVHPSEYPMPVSSYLLQNDGTGKFEIANSTLAPELENIGLICDALWTDYDNDGWVDLMLAGEWMPITLFKNEKGKLQKTIPAELANLKGWWNSIVAADFDLDGDMDYVVGNLGTNTLLKADEDHTFSVYAADFDANKTDADNPLKGYSANKGIDAILTNHFPNQEGEMAEFPFFNRADMEKQLVLMKRLFLRHHDYGKAEIKTVLEYFKDIEPYIAQANYTKSSYLENVGNGQFKIKTLPKEVQIAPIYGMISSDVNNDQYPDLILTGNDYGTEVGMGRYDALNGLVLLNDTNGGFIPQLAEESGIYIEGDGKSLVRLKGKDNTTLIAAGQNRGALKVFQQKKEQISMPLQAFDAMAIIELEDGRSFKQEFPYGNSFLSQSSRYLWLPDNTKSCTIIDFSGNSRTATIDDMIK